jgi:hypothetical protein
MKSQTSDAERSKLREALRAERDAHSETCREMQQYKVCLVMKEQFVLQL